MLTGTDRQGQDTRMADPTEPTLLSNRHTKMQPRARDCQSGLEPAQIPTALWPAAAEQVALNPSRALCAYWATRLSGKGVWT